MARFWEKIQSLFTGQKDDKTTYDPDDVAENIHLQSNDSSLAENALSVYPTEQQEAVIETPEVQIPYWLEDEDMLRDEGVLFGLSESTPSEKTEIIGSYFEHLTAEHERNIELQNERIQEVNLYIGQREARIEELTLKLREIDSPVADPEHNLPRTLVGLAFSIAMCVGNYFLIEESLRGSFSNSEGIALGVFLAGMFNLFGRISLFHDDNTNVSWRRLLEEVGMPLAASLFVFAQAWSSHTWWQSVSLFVFVFFLFLFAGKLLLSNITMLRGDLRIWLRSSSRKTEEKNNIAKWDEEVVSLRAEIDEYRTQRWQYVKDQGKAETERDRLYARRDMLIKLFESEFYLARHLKSGLTNKQLKAIRGE